jgi:hypothetical protein
LRVDEAGSDEPVVGFDGFVEIVAAGWGAGFAVCELGCCGEVELVFDCSDAGVGFVPPVGG